ncbi:MAG TPA: hypothetical protein VFI02_05780 [Armatimonadota bacterium]|nr:hypothetical protein [Armatimonadota bacterium]
MKTIMSGWSMTRSTALSILLLVLVSSACLAQSDDELLQLAIAGCRNALSLVKSGQGGFTVDAWVRSKNGVVETDSKCFVVFVGDRYKVLREKTYVQNALPPDAPPDLVKSLIKPGEKLVDEFSYDGTAFTEYDHEVNTVTKTGTGESKAPQLRGLHRTCSRLIAMSGHGLYDIGKTGPPREEGTPDTGVKVVRRESLNGDNCIVIQREFPIKLDKGEVATRRFVYWVNPEKGFTIPKAQHWVIGSQYKEWTLIEEEITEVRDYGGGIWGPAKWTMQQWQIDESGKEPMKMMDTVLTYDPTYKLNPDVKDDELAIHPPSGTRIWDETLDATYKAP